MSILNNAANGRYSIIFLLYKLVVMQGPISRATLADSLRASVGKDSNNTVENSLKTAISLGVFVESTDGTISIEADTQKNEITDKSLHKHLRKIIRDNVFDQKNLGDLKRWHDIGEDDNWSGATDFIVLVTWFLSLPFLKIPSGYSNADTMQTKMLKDYPQQKLVQNSNRFGPHMESWVIALGFGQNLNGRLFVDPTNVLCESLDHLFKQQKTMTMNAFVESMGSVIPVLEGGAFRKMVEAKLGEVPEAWTPRPNKTLSQATSVALKRLEANQWIKFQDKADAPDGKWTLVDFQFEPIASYTHIEMIKS